MQLLNEVISGGHGRGAFYTVLLVLMVMVGCRREPPPQSSLSTPVAPPPVDAVPSIPFANATRELGIDFSPTSGAAGEKLLPESGGSGLALFDYDGDGDEDLLLLSGAPWPWDQPKSEVARSAIALYRNDGKRFTDITQQAGLDIAFYAQGVAVGDYDGDSDLDLFLTGVGACYLLRNDDGLYVNVSDQSGIASHSADWTTSAGFFDYDRDGDLDLFVCNYVEWSHELDTAAGYQIAGIGRAYAPPFNFAGTHSFLYRNDGRVFRDVSKEAGIVVTQPGSDEAAGKALALSFLDFDHDGWLDIFVANDTVRNFLFRNKSDGTFEEVGIESGVAFDANGAATSAMGTDMAWMRNNGDIAIAVGNFANEMTSLFVAQADQAVFTDESMACGIGGPTRAALSFGLLFDDFDLDGRVDLVQANGHLEQQINVVQPSQSYRQPSQLFWNAGDDAPREFVPLDADAIGDLASPIVGRAVGSCDLDSDGDLDLVVSQVDGPPMVLVNQQSLGHNWLSVLVRDAQGAADGIGAVVELEADGIVQRRLVTRTRSYLTQTPPQVTFGLGRAETINRLTVIWPDGSTQQVTPDGINRRIEVRRSGGDYAGLLSRSKALFELAKYDQALDAAEQAARLRPGENAPLRNIARCHLLAGRPEDAQQALNRLPKPDQSAATPYLRGLIATRRFDYEQAASFFRESLQRRSDVAAVHFQLGKALSAQRDDEAATEAFRKVAALDPLHGAAQFQLANLSRKRGATADFANYWRDYQRIRKLKGDLVSDEVVLEACVLSDIETASRAPAPVITSEPKFAARPIGKLSRNISDIAALTVEQGGQYVLVSVSVAGEIACGSIDENADWIPRGTVYQLPGFNAAGRLRLAVANAIVDGREDIDHNEIVVANDSRTWLLNVTSDGSVQDHSQTSGLQAANGDFGRWCDVDHDGAIDWLTVTDGKLAVWRNHGDGRFSEATQECGLADCYAETVLAIDMQPDNLGTDLIVTAENGTQLWQNQLGGVFAHATDEVWPPAVEIQGNDFDGDGLADILLVSSGGIHLRRSSSPEWTTVDFPSSNVHATCTIDFNNDGSLDLAVASENQEQWRVDLYANSQGTMLPTTWFADEVRPAVLRDIDVDHDGRTDLLCVDRDGQVQLFHNQTSNAGQQIKLALQSYVGQSSSIGTRVQLRWGANAVTRYTDRQLPIEIGIGDADKIDVIQTLWNNGVVHNELDIDLRSPVQRIDIVNFIRTSSCPFLYVLNGGEWQFVTDILGAAPLNVAARRGSSIPPDDDEVVLLRPWHEEAAPPPEGVRLTTELREALLLDQVQWITAIHPRGTVVLPYDQISTEPASGVQLALVKDVQQIDRAIRNDGVDVSDHLISIDDETTPAGPPLKPPALGYTAPGGLVLEFGKIDSTAPLALIATGWYRFGSSTTNVAAGNRDDVATQWPELEARVGNSWQPMDAVVGFPAGNTKSIVCDLTGKIPANTEAFRLSTSFEVRWDAFHLATLLPREQIRLVTESPTSAELAWHGVSQLASRSLDEPLAPVQGSSSHLMPWLSNLEGWYTRYGDVRHLLATADHRMVLMACGDGVTVWAPNVGAPVPNDEVTTPLLYVRGWIKEWDPNAVPAESLAPFPGSDRSTGPDDWQLEYNTRWVPRW